MIHKICQYQKLGLWAVNDPRQLSDDRGGAAWVYHAFSTVLHTLQHTFKCWLPCSLPKSSYQISSSRVK
jgi:hypothetical protein